MITIFNGKQRRLGHGASDEVYVQVEVRLREHLSNLKGARLSVLLAIALHADADGLAWPSYGTLVRETGYARDTVARALSDLCKVTLDGHRILARWQPVTSAGQFTSNRYLVFPSTEELELIAKRVSPCTEKPNTVEPNTVEPHTENHDTNYTHDKVEPSKEKPKGQPATEAAAGPSKDEEGKPVMCSIHGVEMTERSKDGATWYSHKVGDGWCKGGLGDTGKVEDRARQSEANRFRYMEWGNGGGK